MKSLCIKTNNSNQLNYLLNELKSIDLKNICFSENKFKLYRNIIIHYTGQNEELFLSKISSILCFLIIDEVEETLLKRLICQNYFYFNSIEQEKILATCFDQMADDFALIFDEKYETLYYAFHSFLSNHHSLVLNGFINFRIKEYMNILDQIVNKSVNYFVIEQEYLEFISLLKLYINSQNCGCKMVHLIFSENDTLLLDENKDSIIITDDIFNAKFLSDINFSTNDYILNSLLTILPEKIYIHLFENCTDEFVNTLQAIFENRVSLCTNCNICQLYKDITKETSTKKIENPH